MLKLFHLINFTIERIDDELTNDRGKFVQTSFEFLDNTAPRKSDKFRNSTPEIQRSANFD